MPAMHWFGQDGQYRAKGHKFGVDYYVTRVDREWKLEEYAGEADANGKPVFVYVDTFPTLGRAEAHAQYREGAPAHLGIGPAKR